MSSTYNRLCEIAARLRAVLPKELDLSLSPAPHLHDRKQYPPVRQVICYAVRGGPEGFWVHVDFVYWARIGSNHEAEENLSGTLSSAAETVIMGKFETADISQAADAARIITIEIEKHPDVLFEMFMLF